LHFIQKYVFFVTSVALIVRKLGSLLFVIRFSARCVAH
jgi:hypothetical protein